MSKYKQSNPFPTIYVGILIIASLFAFSPAFTNGFVNWDDYAYIVNNNLVTEFSFANIVKMFTPTTFVVGNYHPLTVLVYSIEHALFGLDPAAYHTVNVMIHLINVLLASLIAWRLLHHRMATLFMTSLFALHPMRVESVVWAAELKDVLYVCFFLGGIYRYIVNAQESREGIRDYAYVYGLFILSLLSKGQAVVFPLILLVVDFTLTRHITKKLILSKVPFFVTSLAFGFLAIAAQRGGQLSVVGPQLVLPFHERLACALYGVLMYFVKFLVPVNLACFYDYPLPEQMGVIFVYAGASASVLITLVWLARRNRMLLGGVIWFFIVIGPVSQIMPVGNALYADRYSYLSMMGIALALGYALKRSSDRIGPQTQATAVVMITSIMMFLTYQQSQTWNSNVTLWTAALKANPQSALIMNNLAGDYLDNGKLEQAIPLFEQAIGNPGRYKEIYRTLNNLGLAVSKQGKLDSSLYWFKKSMQTDSIFPDPYFNRGSVLLSLNRLTEAHADYTRYLALTSGDARGYLMRAKILRAMDSVNAAVRDYKSAIKKDPKYLDAYFGLANIYFSMNQFKQADEVYSNAITQIPDNGDLFLNRAKVRYVMNDIPAALQDYDNGALRGAQEPPFRLAIIQRMPTMTAQSPVQIRK